MSEKNYIKIAKKYANDVISGKIIASQYVIKACQRFNNFLKRKDIYLCDKNATKICKFMELLPHIKGSGWKFPVLQLEPWQVFILVNINGWRHKKDDLRVFRNVYIQISRKNGKSFIASGIGLFFLSADSEEGAEIFCVATSTDQAKEVWQVAKNMVDKINSTEKGDVLYEYYKSIGITDEELNGGLFYNYFGIETSAKSIYVDETYSLFQAKHSKSDRLDGLNSHCVIVDELHAHKDGSLYSVMEESVAAREQPLVLSITTAGNVLNGICTETLKFCRSVLDGAVVADDTFAMIYEIDSVEEFDQPDMLIKANPNYGVSVKKDYLINKIEKTKDSPLLKNQFLTKHCNIFVQSTESFFDPDKIEALPDDDVSLEDCLGKYPTYLGIDLAQKHDLCAVAVLFDRGSDFDGARYKTFVKCYIPKSMLRQKHNLVESYILWEKQGYLVATDGETTDYEYIYKYIDDVVGASPSMVKFIGFDQYNAFELSKRLEQIHPESFAVKQTSNELSEPQKKLGSMVIEKSIDIGGNSCLKWQLGNVYIEMRQNQTILFKKEDKNSVNKIDGAVALSMAIIGLYLEETETDIGGFLSVFD